jgi:HSP20 family protein
LENFLILNSPETRQAISEAEQALEAGQLREADDVIDVGENIRDRDESADELMFGGEAPLPVEVLSEPELSLPADEDTLEMMIAPPLFDFARSPSSSQAAAGGPSSVPIDLRQTDTAFILEATLPGFKPDEIEVGFQDGFLTIQAERTLDSTEEEGLFLRHERRHVPTFRRVGLPGAVHVHQIRATFDSGELKVVIPRVHSTRSERIMLMPRAVAGQEEAVEHR